MTSFFGKKRFLAAIFIGLWILAFFIIYFASQAPAGFSRDIRWGVSFSKLFAAETGFEWRDVYLAILDDLRPKYIRLPIYWSDVERAEGGYDFSDYDWMLQEAADRNVGVILAVGRKLPRWPECHDPLWLVDKSDADIQPLLDEYITQTVTRYRDMSNIRAWQVENEPFLPFGECPTVKAAAVDREVALVRSLDDRHPVIVTDSGELSIWLRAAKRADIFGTTMYRIVWNKMTGYLAYPLPPKFFWFKANVMRLFYPDRPIIVSELQAEPWGPQYVFDMALSEQNKSMSIEQFHANIDYARAVGFNEVYLWGAEWWYWMKEKHFHPEFWQAAQGLLNE